MNSDPIRFTARLLQYPGMAPWFRIPARFIRAWELTATTTVEGTIDGHQIGRRAIKDSGAKTEDWYMGLTKELASRIGCAQGDEIEVELHLADMTLPPEMAELMSADGAFARAFEALNVNHKRKAIEHYLEAKTPAGRTARLGKIERSIKQRLAARGQRPA